MMTSQTSLWHSHRGDNHLCSVSVCTHSGFGEVNTIGRQHTDQNTNRILLFSAHVIDKNLQHLKSKMIDVLLTLNT